MTQATRAAQVQPVRETPRPPRQHAHRVLTAHPRCVLIPASVMLRCCLPVIVKSLLLQSGHWGHSRADEMLVDGPQYGQALLQARCVTGVWLVTSEVPCARLQATM